MDEKDKATIREMFVSLEKLHELADKLWQKTPTNYPLQEWIEPCKTCGRLRSVWKESFPNKEDE